MLRMLLLVAAALAGGACPGCITVPVSVGNPIPGMTTIAVAPFFNLSAEPTVDGRRFALAYYSELQKTAHYQVLPVGVVETAIRENDLDMGSPQDVVKLAKLLDVDAVVVGAVTDYVPYYPPQLAMHIQWYSAQNWVFLGSELPPAPPVPPCIPGEAPCPPASAASATSSGPPSVRAQSPNEDDRELLTPSTLWAPPAAPLKLTQSASQRGKGAVDPGPVVWPSRPDPSDANPRGMIQPPADNLEGAFAVQTKQDAPQPVMSYTRYFDGGDKRLTSRLKGYYHLRGDMRSGGWEAYLHRSDDFLRFTAHVMIVEMLSMHGAALETDWYFRTWKWK